MKLHTLIASDIDGAPIPEEPTAMPEIISPPIRAAWDRGYLLLAASGRLCPRLCALFDSVADKMAFPFENGAVTIALALRETAPDCSDAYAEMEKLLDLHQPLIG